MTIAAQVPYSPSEQPIVTAGHEARRAGVAITENPHPAVCPASLRRHWLWDQGWYTEDRDVQGDDA